MNRLAFLLPALLLLPGIARGEGINLSWDECGVAGVSFKTFACDRNDPPAMVLVASFSPPPGMQGFNGIAGTLDFRVSDPAFDRLPDWWKFSGALETPQACRDSNGLIIDTDFEGACQNPYSAGVPRAAYRYDFGPFAANPPPTPDLARLIAFVGYPPPALKPLIEGVEYYAFRLRLTGYRTVGPDSCRGCVQPACIVLNSVEIGEGFESVVVSMPLDRNHVTWQVPLADCPVSTPTRNTTWGRIRTLYR